MAVICLADQVRQPVRTVWSELRCSVGPAALRVSIRKEMRSSDSLMPLFWRSRLSSGVAAAVGGTFQPDRNPGTAGLLYHLLTGKVNDLNQKRARFPKNLEKQPITAQQTSGFRTSKSRIKFWFFIINLEVLRRSWDYNPLHPVRGKSIINYLMASNKKINLLMRQKPRQGTRTLWIP